MRTCKAGQTSGRCVHNSATHPLSEARAQSRPHALASAASKPGLPHAYLHCGHPAIEPQPDVEAQLKEQHRTWHIFFSFISASHHVATNQCPMDVEWAQVDPKVRVDDVRQPCSCDDLHSEDCCVTQMCPSGIQLNAQKLLQHSLAKSRAQRAGACFACTDLVTSGAAVMVCGGGVQQCTSCWRLALARHMIDTVQRRWTSTARSCTVTGALKPLH